ncbi:hypothetical protein BDQ17DRAFT_1434394 [Cyathus striatus]|nr:hypothetical protein BDQ17DRAFT_1434394 [Cyathus striatus]
MKLVIVAIMPVLVLMSSLHLVTAAPRHIHYMTITGGFPVESTKILVAKSDPTTTTTPVDPDSPGAFRWTTD